MSAYILRLRGREQMIFVNIRYAPAPRLRRMPVFSHVTDAANEDERTPLLSDMRGLGEARKRGLNVIVIQDSKENMAGRLLWSAVKKGCLLVAYLERARPVCAFIGDVGRRRPLHERQPVAKRARPRRHRP